MSTQKKLPQLGPINNDKTASLLKGIAGAFPIVGNALAEIIGHVIPNQRLDRIEKYLMEIAKELATRRSSDSWPHSDADFDETLAEPHNTDLLERGARQAAHALSESRLKYIVECVINGIAADEREKIHHVRMLKVVDELDDEEIAILNGILNGGLEKLRPRPSDEVDKNLNEQAMFQVALAKLERLGLLEFERPVATVETSTREYPPENVYVPLDHGEWRVTRAGEMVLMAIGIRELTETTRLPFD